MAFTPLNSLNAFIAVARRLSYFVYPETSREAGSEIEGAARADELRANLRKAGLTRPQL